MLTDAECEALCPHLTPAEFRLLSPSDSASRSHHWLASLPHHSDCFHCGSQITLTSTALTWMTMADPNSASTPFHFTPSASFHPLCASSTSLPACLPPTRPSSIKNYADHANALSCMLLTTPSSRHRVPPVVGSTIEVQWQGFGDEWFECTVGFSPALQVLVVRNAGEELSFDPHVDSWRQ